MANLLKYLAVGHASSNDPNKITPLVAAGLSHDAHLNKPAESAHTIIDRGQNVESDVQKTGQNLAKTIPTVKHQTLSAVSHTWESVEHGTQTIDHIVIPWLDDIEAIPRSV